MGALFLHEIQQSLSYLSLDWPLLSPLCHDGVAVTRSALFHPSSTSEGKREGGSDISFSWKTLEKCKDGNVTRFFSFWCIFFSWLFLVSSWLSGLWQSNHCHTNTRSFLWGLQVSTFPCTSSSETCCLKLHVITALYRLKEENLLGEKLAVGLGIVPDTSVSHKTEICKKIFI